MSEEHDAKEAIGLLNAALFIIRDASKESGNRRYEIIISLIECAIGLLNYNVIVSNQIAKK